MESSLLPPFPRLGMWPINSSIFLSILSSPIKTCDNKQKYLHILTATEDVNASLGHITKVFEVSSSNNILLLCLLSSSW